MSASKFSNTKVDPYFSGRQRRLSKFFRNGPSSGTVIVPMDHSMFEGAFKTGRSLTDMARSVSDHGGDAVVVHMGRMRQLDTDAVRNLAVVVHVARQRAARERKDINR